MVPVKVLVPSNSNCPLETLNVPLPEITLLKYNELLRLMLKVPPDPIEISPETAPVLPPFPNCRVPAEIVVNPVAVLSAVKISLPAPVLVNASVLAPPLRMRPSKVDVPEVRLSVRVELVVELPFSMMGLPGLELLLERPVSVTL